MRLWAFLLGLLLEIATAKRSDYRTSYACEGRTLNIACEEGYHINLLRANFGRFSISICNEHGSLDWSVDCTSHRSYSVIHERCNSMSSCSVRATSDIFADPCPDTYKYLEVQYQCIQESLTLPIPLSSTIASIPSSTARPPIIIPLTRSTQLTSTVQSELPTTATEEESLTTTPSPIVILLSTTKIYTAASTSTPVVLFNSVEYSAKEVRNWAEYCKPAQSRNLLWNWTLAGTDSDQKCPSGTTGEAHWYCATDPVEWATPYPDLSNCKSLWVDYLRKRVDDGDSVVNVAAELSGMTHRKPLYGGDVKQAAEILHLIITKMSEKMKELADDKQRHQLLQELLENASDVASNLFSVSPSWGEINPKDRKHVASTLLDALELSGWLLASAQKSAFRFQKGLRNIFMSIQVLEVWTVSHITFPTIEDINNTLLDHVEDTIRLPSQVLMSTASDGLVKMVFAVYEGVKDFLGSSTLETNVVMKNTSYVINSKVISAYTGRYHGMKFSEPVTITFKIIQVENVTNPKCVFWDMDRRLWSEEGCWLRKSNKTHAICECNHLTNFALLMELSSGEESSDNISVEILMYTSCGISIIFLLMTAILLQMLRCFPTDHTLVCKHLCICLILTEASYIGGVNQVHVMCSIFAGIMHFLLQSVFLWLFLSVFQLYMSLVERTHCSRIRYYTAIAYGIPAVIVCMFCFVNLNSYGSHDYCFLRYENHSIFGFVVPAVACVVGACICFMLTMCKLCTTEEKDFLKINTIKAKNCQSLFVVLVVTSCWAFMMIFMERKERILAFIFAAFNFLQSFAIFIFFGIKNSEVQQAFIHWKEGSFSQSKVARGQFSLPNTSHSSIGGMPYLAASSTVSSLATVASPQLEFPMNTFHHSELYHATRSPIYDNRERLVS